MADQAAALQWGKTAVLWLAAHFQLDLPPPGKRHWQATWVEKAMDEDRQELLRQLFVAATELVETAHEAAVAGQSSALAADGYATAAHRLQAAASDAAALAEAAVIVARPGPGNGREPT